MYDPSRRPTAKTQQELAQQHIGMYFWAGPAPWHACDCGSPSFEVVEFGQPYRCTNVVCRKPFTDFG